MKHTHKDIDHAFSGAFERPICNDAVNLGDLLEHVKETFDGTAIVSRLQMVANWAEVCKLP